MYAKIAKVTATLGAWEADKRNEQQRYDYISADAVLNRVGRAMAEFGLVVVPSITDAVVEAVDYTDSRGNVKQRYDARVMFEMVIADSEKVTPELRMTWAGAGSDYAVPDKAVYKAITSGHKYFLMKLFCIGVGNDDGEHEPPNGGAVSTGQRNGHAPHPRPQGESAAPESDAIADARAWLEGETATLRAVAAAAVMTGRYGHAAHAYNALKSNPDIVEHGVEVKAAQVVKPASALRLFDWLVSRKAEEAEDAGE